MATITAETAAELAGVTTQIDAFERMDDALRRVVALAPAERRTVSNADSPRLLCGDLVTE